MIQASPQTLAKLRKLKANGGVNWTSPNSPVGPDWYDSYIGTSPIPNDHPPSLKNPIITKIPTAQDGWKKGDSKKAREQAMDDLVELHKRMRRQIGKPEIFFPGSMPSGPQNVANWPIGTGLSSSAAVIEKLKKRIKAYSPSEARDKTGKWTSDPGGEEHTTAHGDHMVPAQRDTTGKRTLADGSKLPSHLSKARIPPAWTGVVVNTNPRGDLMAQGHDVKGRLQSIYSDKHSTSVSAQKFARIKSLEAKEERITAENTKNHKKDPDHSDAIKLIMHTGIRPGSDTDTLADKQAYGATTLQGKHVVQDGDNVSLQFVGKKGVSLNIPVSDPHVASMITARAQASGPEGHLFGDITDDSLRDYTHTLDGGKFKPKDFRTLLANKLAVGAMSSVAEPTNLKEYKQAVKTVATAVSQKLGNTPAVSLASYINPVLFAPWRGSAHV
jgi:DNA topoisomerase-1